MSFPPLFYLLQIVEKTCTLISNSQTFIINCTNLYVYNHKLCKPYGQFILQFQRMETPQTGDPAAGWVRLPGVQAIRTDAGSEPCASH